MISVVSFEAKVPLMGATTVSIMTLSIMTLSIMTLSIMTFSKIIIIITHAG